MTNAFFSWAGGAASGAFLGMARRAYLNTTIETKFDKYKDEYDKTVSVLGEEAALESFRRKIESLSSALNGKTKGYIENTTKAEGKNTGYIGFLNMEQNLDFIKKNNLEQFIVQNEDGSFRPSDKVENLDSSMFFNKIKTNEKNEDGTTVYKSVENEDYAINSNVRGLDITDDGRVNVTESSNITENGKTALKSAENVDYPVALYNEINNDEAFFGENGVLYINEHNLTTENAQTVVIKHEMLHAIRQNDQGAYDDMKKIVDSFVTMTFDKNGKPQFDYTNDDIKKIMQDSGMETRIIKSITEYYKELLDNDGMTIDEAVAKAIAMAEEDIVAYFIEQVVDNKTFLNEILKKQPKLFEAWKDRFNSNKEINKMVEGNNKAKKLLKDLRDKFNEAVQKTKEDKKRLKLFLENVFGSEENKELERINKILLEKYGINFDELVASMDIERGVFVINEEDVDFKTIADLIQFDIAETRPKRIKNKEIIEQMQELDTEEGRKTAVYSMIEQVIKYMDKFSGFVGWENAMFSDNYQEAAKFTFDIEDESELNAYEDTIGFLIMEEFDNKFEFQIVDNGDQTGSILVFPSNDYISKHIENMKTIGDLLLTRGETVPIEYSNLVSSIIDFGEAYDWYGFYDAIDDVDAYEQELLDSPDRLMLEVEAVEEAYKQVIEDDSLTDEVKEAYNDFKKALSYLNAPKTQKPVMKSKTKEELTQEEIDEGSVLFQDAILMGFLKLDKKGRYVMKNNKISTHAMQTNQINLKFPGESKGTKYSSTVYGLNAYNEVGEMEIPIYDSWFKKSNLVKIEDMNKAEHALHSFFSSTNLNYVLYRKKVTLWAFLFPVLIHQTLHS